MKPSLTHQCSKFPIQGHTKIMRPQLPEHAVVSLLRQCFQTPRCQTWRQSAPRSSISLHCARQRLGASRTGQQQRPYQTSNIHALSEQSQLSANDPIDSSTELLRIQGSQSGGLNAEENKINIAVLGGGITGLSSAHYLAKEFPDANITIYEGSDRLGGWVKSKRIEVGLGHIIFEQGPRSLRPGTPAGLLTLDMVCLMVSSIVSSLTASDPRPVP